MKLLTTVAVTIWLIAIDTDRHPFAGAEFLRRPGDSVGSIGSDSPTEQDGAAQQHAQSSHGEVEEEQLSSAAVTVGHRAHALDRDKRSLQLEGLYDFDSNAIFPLSSSTTQHGGGKGRHRGSGKKGPMFQSNNQNKWSRSKMLARAVDDIVVNSDRYNLWWTGPLQNSDFFQPAAWSAKHNFSSNAIFTMVVVPGPGSADSRSCSSPNDLKLYLGTARKAHLHGDIVLALEEGLLSGEVRAILQHYRAVVYVLPGTLCSRSTSSMFCGSEAERVPASVFRYYFFEKWASLYSSRALLLVTDFRGVVFQSDPFSYRRQEWFPDHQLAVFQEFHPNMVIGRCSFQRSVMMECFGDDALRLHVNRVAISAGAFIGSRDGMLVWAHHMTMQLQDAPGRMVDTRCIADGIDHSFVNVLVYGHKLRALVRIFVFPHGEGVVNSLGGLNPSTVEPAFLRGSLVAFWRLLSSDGYILNWNGDISPVVHQLDRFQSELVELADTLIDPPLPTPGANSSSSAFGSMLPSKYVSHAATFVGAFSAGMGSAEEMSRLKEMDRAWQALAASQCLFDCIDSIHFSTGKKL